MSQNDDLDMQTFQIYQDDETVPVPVNGDDVKKKIGVSSNEDGSGSKNKDAIKGVLLGLGVLVLVIVIDQLMH